MKTCILITIFTLIASINCDVKEKVDSKEWEHRVHGLEAYIYGNENDEYYWDENYDTKVENAVPCIESWNL